MGAGHAHTGAGVGTVRVRRLTVVVVLGAIGLAVVAALLGTLHWWPDAASVHRDEGRIATIGPGVQVVHGRLVRVRAQCGESRAPGGSCGASSVRVLDGSAAGRTVALALTADVVGSGLRPGDEVLLLQSGGGHGGAAASFSFYRDDRVQPMLWLAALFAALVVLVAWWRGFMALVGLGFAGAVGAVFLVPALLSGRPPVPVTVAASVLILVVLLYATHGLSMRTSVALLGALAGVGLSALFAWLGVVGTRLGGLGDDPAALLTVNAGWVDVQQLVVASVVLAGLGTLNDVTVTQASALWELRAASPDATPAQLYRRAMRIGRDHVASNVYTIAFAYTGTALVLLVAVQLYRGTPWDFVTSEDVAEEIVRTLVGGIALVLAMPLTTAVAVLVAGSAEIEAPLARYR